MNQIEKLIAHEAIAQKLYQYCYSLDEKNWSALQACFAPEHVHNHGTYRGDRDGFLHFVKLAAERFQASHHSISNLVVELDEDNLTASSKAYFNAMHRIDGKKISEMYFFNNEIDEVDSDWLVAGIYEDRWVFRDNEWLIIERNAKHICERVEPVTPESL